MATNNIPTAPKPPSSGGGGGGGGGGNTSPPAGGGGNGGGAGGSGGGGGMSGYERRQNAKEQEYKRKASRRYLDQAATLGKQVRAWNFSLNQGFKEALDQRLANVLQNEQQQDDLLMEGYKKRVGSLEGAKKDNEKSELDQSYANLTNRGRERANALSEAALQGAGESDNLRAQSMALRNWDANQSEVNRSFFDTLRSINSSLTDLNVDTKSARANVSMEANADREQLWTNYYGQRSEAYTQLGNIKGQQAELYGLAHEQVSSKSSKGKQKSASNQSGNYFMQAAKANAEAWENPGLSKKIQDWEGRADFKGVQNQSRWVNREVVSDAPARRPEGATLREW